MHACIQLHYAFRPAKVEMGRIANRRWLWCVCVCVCVCIYIYIYVYVCMYVCMYAHACIRICTQTQYANMHTQKCLCFSSICRKGVIIRFWFWTSQSVLPERKSKSKWAYFSSTVPEKEIIFFITLKKKVPELITKSLCSVFCVSVLSAERSSGRVPRRRGCTLRDKGSECVEPPCRESRLPRGVWNACCVYDQ
jgi:hypothetical protein